MTKTIHVVPMLGLAALALLADAAEVRRQNGRNWETVPVMQLSDIAGFVPSRTVKLDRFGGLAERRVKATGFFRTEKLHDRWWLVDPEGGLFLSVGINSVNLSQSNGELAPTGCSSTGAWATAAARLLLTNGFNTLGCWSTYQAFKGPARMAYTPDWAFMASFGEKCRITYWEFGHWEYPSNCIPVFHPGFETHCDEYARQLAGMRDDPWLVGHFSDNELPFRPDALDNYLSLPSDDPGHQAARKWWDERRRKTGRAEIGEGDRSAFLQLVANRYFSVVGAAIRKYDPNHLYLGSRLHGKGICEPVFRGSTAVDVVGVNYYGAWTPDLESLRRWSQWSGRPILLTEWYAMKLDTADHQARGAGWRVSTHAERGMFYQHHVLGALRSSVCIGWHWFKYGGDNEPARNGAGIGCVDVQFKPREELFALMRELNAQVYPLAEFFAAGQSGK